MRAHFQEGEAVYSTANLASYTEQHMRDVASSEIHFSTVTL